MILEILGGVVIGGMLFGEKESRTIIRRQASPEDIAEAMIIAKKKEEEMADEKKWLEDTGVAIVDGGEKTQPLSCDVVFDYVAPGLSHRSGGFRVKYLFDDGKMTHNLFLGIDELYCRGTSAVPAPQRVAERLLSDAGRDLDGIYIPSMIKKRVEPSYVGENGNYHYSVRRNRFADNQFSLFVMSIVKAMRRPDFPKIASAYAFSFNNGMVKKTGDPQ